MQFTFDHLRTDATGAHSHETIALTFQRSNFRVVDVMGADLAKRQTGLSPGEALVIAGTFEEVSHRLSAKASISELMR